LTNKNDNAIIKSSKTRRKYNTFFEFWKYVKGGFAHWILLNQQLNILVVWQVEVPVKKAFTIDDPVIKII